MSEAICVCSSIGADPSVLRFCDFGDHHKYWLGDRELPSVTTIIRETMGSSYNMDDPRIATNVENARIRGILVDRYFAEYLTTGTVRLAVGERQDVKDLLGMLCDWWCKHPEFYEQEWECQVKLHDGHIAGTCDLLSPAMCLELKVVYEVQATYGIQLGGYIELNDIQLARHGIGLLGQHWRDIGVILVNKRNVRWVPYEADQCVADWKRTKAMWQMKNRLKEKR